MGKPFLVVNPRSAGGATARHFDEVAAAARGALGECAHAFTDRPGHATELTRAALRSGAGLVVAIGGDGTINEVVNGFFEPLRPGESPRAVDPGAALAILPRGTGGDFRRTLGLDGALAKSAARLRGERRRVDVGRVDYTGAGGGSASRLFINVSGAGVGARIVDISNASTKVLGGKLTFLLASLRGLAGWRDVAVRARLDAGPVEDLSVTSFSVANGRFFGGGMEVAPGARIDDGLFHVTIWSGFGLGDFILRAGRMYDGSHVRLPGTRVATAKTVRLERGGRPGSGAAGEILVEADGEGLGHLPADFTILPGALSLLC
ncbi:MAG: diacylglycerol kinase family lipid kinase [Myxococcales bacterium]